MDRINITEYKAALGTYVAYIGRATLKDRYEFANGDESFYHFIGKNSCYSMLELLHPDDADEFVKMTQTLGKERECAILRMKNADNIYRLIYVEMWLNGAVYNGVASISFEFCSFMELKDRYIVYSNIIKKYREFMGLSDTMFFEYTLDTDDVKIYRYENLKSVPVRFGKLEEIFSQIKASDAFSGKSKSEFQALYEYLKKGMDRFSMKFDAGPLLEGEDGRLLFKGSSLYDNGARIMTVGTITRIGEEKDKGRYYLSDNAFDPGTGVWNKRAIHEYAVEKTLENRSIYLAIMDVDDFKKVNDTYGHMFGDKVLSRLSEVLQGVIDSRGAVGRFGGDEFMLVFDTVDTEEELRRIFKTVSKNLQWNYKDLADSVPITTSCGVARYPDDAANFEELFQKADKALYIAKAKGKNRFIIYDEAKHGKIVNEDQSERNAGIKAIASDGRKAAEMSEVVMALYQNGASALPEAMEKIRVYFDVDGVTVYQGADLHRALTAGKYINPLEKLDLAFDESYLGLFDAQGVLKIANIEKLKNNWKDAHRQYELQETKEFIQYVAYKDHKPMAVVAFDYFNRTPKVGTSDNGLMTMIGRLMAAIARDHMI